MKKIQYIQYLGFIIFALLIVGCNSSQRKVLTNDEVSFDFVFMTDIHLQPEKNAASW